MSKCYYCGDIKAGSAECRGQKPIAVMPSEQEQAKGRRTQTCCCGQVFYDAWPLTVAGVMHSPGMCCSGGGGGGGGRGGGTLTSSVNGTGGAGGNGSTSGHGTI